MIDKSQATREYVAALHEDSWENLQRAHPVIAMKLGGLVEAGATPDEIFSLTMRSGHSPDLAKWCKQAAAHLAAEE